jgi:hypothetical protein
MVLFDATLNNDPQSYERFRQWFCDSYTAEASTVLSEVDLARSIELRRRALRHWLDHPVEAPIGMRKAREHQATAVHISIGAPEV